MATLVSDIINQAFADLGVIQPGEAVSTTIQTDAFNRLNELISSLSTEQSMAFYQVRQVFALTYAVDSYALGAGGTWATTAGLRAMKVTSWLATFNQQKKGGPALSMEAFGPAASQAQTMLEQLYAQAAIEGVIPSVPSILTAPIPSLLGADTSYPLIHVRIFPPPSATPGSVEVGYWTPLLQYATVGDTVTLPDGWVDMLHFNLALRLAPMYARVGGIDEVLAANAQNSKASIVAQNQMGTPPPQAA